MSTRSDSVLISVAVVALALGAFATGWWSGRSAATQNALEVRVAALEALLGQEPPPAEPPAPVEVSLEGSPSRGPEDAPVTVVEFSDFQCPFCARVTPTLAQLEQEYGDKLRFVFKHFPLAIHPQAMGAHKASQAAAAQGKFWEMHDLLFENQQALDRDTFLAYARQLDLDLAAFEAALDSPAVEEHIQRDLEQGRQAGINGTPTFLINGRLFSGAQPYTAFKQQVDAALGDAPAAG